MTITAADVWRAVDSLTAAGEFFEVFEFKVRRRQLKGFRNAPNNVIEAINSSRQFGEQPFIVYEGQRYDFTRFFREVDALAAYLQEDLGVKPGDRVAIAMQNRPHWAVAFDAGLLIGAIVVPFNSWGTADDLAYMVEDAGVACVIADDRRAALLREQNIAARVPVLVSEDGAGLADGEVSLDAFLEGAAGRQPAAVSVDGDSPCLILYTSGSTGRPKGVLLDHRAVAQALMNMLYLGYLAITLEGARELRAGATVESSLLTVPLFHATGLIAGLLLPAYVGQKVVYMRKWDVRVALEHIDREKITTLASVPSILKDILTSELRHDYEVGSLLRLVAGGAASPADLPALISEQLPHAARSTGYAMTESMAVATAMAGCIYDLHPTAAGIPSPVIDIRIVDDQGRDLPRGDSGEVQMRGITCLSEYWKKPEATAAAFTADGWLRTGDLGYINADGFLFITGRSKEIVIRGGENIAPAEIEQVAYLAPAVQECVVFGVPDERLGEELALVAYCRPGQSITEDALRTVMRERLPSHKVPAYIHFAEEPLPRNASEKLHKLAVRADFLQRVLAAE